MSWIRCHKNGQLKKGSLAPRESIGLTIRSPNRFVFPSFGPPSAAGNGHVEGGEPVAEGAGVLSLLLLRRADLQYLESTATRNPSCCVSGGAFSIFSAICFTCLFFTTADVLSFEDWLLI